MSVIRVSDYNPYSLYSGETEFETFIESFQNLRNDPPILEAEELSEEYDRFVLEEKNSLLERIFSNQTSLQIDLSDPDFVEGVKKVCYQLIETKAGHLVLSAAAKVQQVVTIVPIEDAFKMAYSFPDSCIYFSLNRYAEVIFDNFHLEKKISFGHSLTALFHEFLHLLQYDWICYDLSLAHRNQIFNLPQSKWYIEYLTVFGIQSGSLCENTFRKTSRISLRAFYALPKPDSDIKWDYSCLKRILYTLIGDGNIEEIKKLLEKHSEIFPYMYDKVILHAVKVKQWDILEIFIQTDSSINAVDVDVLAYVLHQAIKAGRFSIFPLFYELNLPLLLTDEDEGNVYQQTIKYNKMDMLAYLLEHEDFSEDFRDEDNDPLLCAIVHLHEQAVELLLPYYEELEDFHHQALSDHPKRDETKWEKIQTLLIDGPSHKRRKK